MSETELGEVRQRVLKQLETLPDDTEAAHRKADMLLLAWLTARGDHDIVAAWQAADDRRDGFWYA